MNKQRKVVITTTYNEMGIIIDTKVEEVAQPNLQPTCNQLATDTISRQAAIDALCAVCGKACDKSKFVYNAPQDEQVILCPEHYCLCTLPSAQPEPLQPWEVLVAQAVTAEPKRGKWIDETFKPWGLVYHPYKCDQCGEHSEADSNFCPNCGADMRGEQK